jgi:hypothetical protein
MRVTMLAAAYIAVWVALTMTTHTSARKKDYI